MSRARDRKYQNVMRARGVSFRVDAASVTAHVRDLHDRGMPITLIAERAGVSVPTVANYRNGYRMEAGTKVPVTQVSLDTGRAVLGVRFEQPQDVRKSALIPALGAKRRIQALAAVGYTFTCQGDVLFGASRGFRYVQSVLRSEHVFALTHQNIDEAYRDWSTVDPADAGVGAWEQSRIRRLAAARGYAPPDCWDADTIDDPEAIPEWTGRCGTFFGWQIHEKEGIPACGPCAAARDSGQYVLSSERLRQARHDAGLLITDVSRITGIKQATIQSWESGRSKPRFPADLEKVLIALDVTFEQVAEREEQS